MLLKTKKTFYNLLLSKRLLAVVFLAVLVLGFSFSISHAGPIGAEMDAYVKKAGQIQTDAGGNKYVTIGVVNYYTRDYDGRTEVKLNGNWMTVGGGGFNSTVPELVNAQADRGELKLQSTPSGTVTFTDVKNEAKTDVAQTSFGALLAPVIAVLFAIVYFLKIFVSWSAMVLDFVLNPNFYNFTSNSMIVQGWTMVRDICNLFFLLVLLFIAICTILKIEKYHAKKTLLTLIIMALLINFSKPIAIFIFDGSQLLMNEFLRQMGSIKSQGQTGSTMVTKATEISTMIYDSIPKYFGGTSTSADIFVSYLFATVFLFMLMVALLVTAIFLIIRIVVIMLLIIVSPLAFFAAIVPDFSKMSSQWWSALFEYSYYGPAAAFFLLLATKLSDVLPEITKVQNSGTPSFDKLSTNIIHYIVVLVFLYASIFMAKKFGGGAGAAVVGNANKFMKWGAGMTKGGGMWGGAARITGAADAYKGVKQGIGKQPFWRVLTKEGREARSKERTERWEDRTAPFSIATAKKKAKERENDAKEDILRDAAKGDAAAILEASRRGIDTENKDLWTNPNIIKALGNNDLREAAYGNLRDKGKTHNVIDAEIARQNISQNETKVRELLDTELGKLSATNLGKQDLSELSKSNSALSKPNIGKEWVQQRLKDFDESDPRLVSNMLSGGHSKNISFIRDLRNGKILKNPNTGPNNQSAGGGTGSQTGGYQSSGYGP